jgi:stress response protein YsnF
MTLVNLNDVDPYHRQTVAGKDIRQFDVYTSKNEQVGRIIDALINEASRIQYLIVALLTTVANKQVLLPAEQLRADLDAGRFYLKTLSKVEVANLPSYSSASLDKQLLSHTHHESAGEIRSTTFQVTSTPLEISAPLEASMPLESRVEVIPGLQEQVVSSQLELTAQPIGSEHEAIAPLTSQTMMVANSQGLDEKDIRLLEERLVIDRKRHKIGEVIVRKQVETHFIQVPVKREKLVVEQISPEHKQLAVINLRQEGTDTIELHDVTETSSITTDATDSTAQSTISGEFASINSAIQFLQAIANQPNSSYGRIHIRVTRLEGTK